ncbi:unnamed protein product [Effrenium voratum]|nr:unnamed protein product [Effrenium voratum]|mmetsp:Transcript_91513/g.218152  ORF Transcript_91513/g.218152 Transcript_91513/m.218152 type:complete len:599 (+) Transcript_91513:93-1889(+)
MGAAPSRPNPCASTSFVPMWVISIENFQKLDHMPKHEELMKAGLLVKRQETHFCIFVSHQWLGTTHPDPHLRQLPVLQAALKNILTGRCTAQSDLASQFFGESKQLSQQELQRLQNGYIWLDWFSIPQEADLAGSLLVDNLTADGTNSPASSDIAHLLSGSSVSSATDQDLYIKSIPFFVEVSDIFLALVPHLYHHDTMQKCNFRSYLMRGWCRLEMWCSILCVKPDQPFLVVKGSDEVEFATSMILTDRPPHEGRFTLKADRQTVYLVMRRALQNQLRALRSAQHWDSYRFTLARSETLLGEKSTGRSLDTFLRDFEFESLDTAKRIRGIGPVECAVLSNDVSMIRRLAEDGFDLSRKVTAKINVEILQHGRSALDFALELCWRRPEVILQLLECKANVHHTDDNGFSPLGACKTADAVELLLKYRAEVNETSGPLHCSPLSLCCVRCAPGEVIAKLIRSRADVNPPSKALGSPNPLANLAVWSCSNPHCFEAADLLLDARADINMCCEAQGIFKAIEMFSRARIQLLGSDSLLVHFFAEWTTTPVGFACFYGGAEFVEFLLAKGADPHKQNARGNTAFQLARGQSVLKVIEDFRSI